MGGAASLSKFSNESASIANVTAFASASEKIVEDMARSPTGDVTFEQALDVLHFYQSIHTKVTTFFPGASASKDILKKADVLLLQRGCNAKNTLFAQSICPDEINHESGDITALFASHLGEVFHMGGLAGIPFTGKTGFSVFANHVPDGGNLFILFAPHIGVSSSGRLGKYSRAGQSVEGTACSPACAALNHCMACKPMPEPGKAPGDYQMDYITTEINKRLAAITDGGKDEDAIQAALVSNMFEIIKSFIDEIATSELGRSSQGFTTTPTLFLLGGIQINMPPPMPDYFQPLMFEVRGHGRPTEDLLAATFR